MLEAIRDHWLATGVKIGMKPAGGIRTSKQALHYLVIVKETLGSDWLTPDLFRFGASSLVNDLLMQLKKEETGRYQVGRRIHERLKRLREKEGRRFCLEREERRAGAAPRRIESPLTIRRKIHRGEARQWPLARAGGR